MITVNPYLNFLGNTEEVFEFYRSVFGGEFASKVRFKDMGEAEGMPKLSEEDANKLMHIALPIGNGTLLMGTDALESMGHSLTMGNNFSIALEVDSAEEAERIFDRLSEGGAAEMPLQRVEWAEKFAMFRDKYDVQWMVSYTGDAQFQAG